MTLTILLPVGKGFGAIVFFGPNVIPSWNEIPIPTTYAGVSVDLETGSSSNDLSGVSDGAVNLYFGGQSISNDAEAAGTTARFQPVRTGTGNTDAVSNMSPGTSVSAADLYSVGYGNSTDHIPAGGFTAGTPGYIGFSLVLPSNGELVYGWMKVTMTNDGTTPGVIHEWAYNDTPNAPINVGEGAIPEPSGVLMLAAGLGGIALRRRRRRD